MCKYVHQKDSTLMLTVKSSAPQVNLRNPLHAGEETRKQGRRHQKSKTGVSVAAQKGFVSSKKNLRLLGWEVLDCRDGVSRLKGWEVKNAGDVSDSDKVTQMLSKEPD